MLAESLLRLELLGIALLAGLRLLLEVALLGLLQLLPESLLAKALLRLLLLRISLLAALLLMLPSHDRLSSYGNKKTGSDPVMERRLTALRRRLRYDCRSLSKRHTLVPRWVALRLPVL